jgi:transposase
MLADQLDFVIGADTHRDCHSLAFVVAPTGAVVDQARIEADARGYARALALAQHQATGRRLWAIEGTGSYGAGLTRFLVARGERVVEVERPARAGAGVRGKSDALDAVRAARGALAEARLATPRRDGRREALRALQRTREGAVGARRQAWNQLRALVVACPEPLRAELRSLTRARLLGRCVRLRPEARADDELRGVLVSLRALARRLQDLIAEARELEREILALVRALAPDLLAEPGVGPITAAQLLISWSHRGRVRSEAAFARLGGSAPIPACSGQTVRHRLDRGGDRHLNRALQTIVLTRRRRHAATIAYIERRRREGKTSREAVRCLKRYLARHFFRVLEAAAAPA